VEALECLAAAAAVECLAVAAEDKKSNQGN
jgi:hypothetical protein